MTEIEKMLKNAGIEKEFEKPAECLKNPYITCDGCMLYDDKKGKCNNRKDYPPFTAEKQLSLIKCLFKISDTKKINIECEDKFCIHNVLGQSDDCDTLEDALASYINDIWQSLTAQEKEEIRNILNG